MKEGFVLGLMKVIPKKTVSRWMGRFARSPFSRRMIPYYIRRFDVDVDQAEKPVSEYRTLLEFFVRKLKNGARPVPEDPRLIISPVDCCISQLGRIENGVLIQAKGVTYTLNALLGGDQEKTESFQEGFFITMYLSPKDYHRIHMPVRGKVVGLSYIPGSLFPVNPLGVRRVRGLFTKNERLITYLDSDAGYVAVVKVGATNVGSIKVEYDQDICTNLPRRKCVETRTYSSKEFWEKGAELGRFEFGSTVILLFQKGQIDWEDLKPGMTLRMGQSIGRIIK
ncbi:phosphatidylserine decarboxylase [Kroppenstedtia pulmonis]|uniref:Phosphatidylserine decarboxylase proenzyme n=1 Tax=Kroppenstedtia pulmonis TaxID=1380685 RepID=A0A7D4C7W0_9BACL|nr:archaetidylserine decarboxylase [Kroppenstedtia pulmonis]QKG85116.1 phosphatidylserine decarboxylase [Kroppenstedtia pulmonis]